RRERRSSGSAGGPGDALDIRLGAGDRVVGELEIVANLTATDEAVVFNRQIGGADTGKSGFENPCGIGNGIEIKWRAGAIHRNIVRPLIAGIQTDVEARPWQGHVGRRRWRRGV